MAEKEKKNEEVKSETEPPSMMGPSKKKVSQAERLGMLRNLLYRYGVPPGDLDKAVAEAESIVWRS